MTATKPELQEKEISVKEAIQAVKSYWRFLLSKTRIIFIVGILCAAIGLLISFIVQPTYKAELTFVLESSGKSKLGGYGSLAAQFGLSLGDAGGMFQDNDNIIALMQSRSMITRTLLSSSGNEQELLIHRYLAFSGLKDDWSDNKALSGINYQTPSRLRDSALGLACKSIIEENVTVSKPDKKLDILAINTTAPDELFAKVFTETLLDNVTKFYIETQTRKMQESVNILRHQVDSVRTLLNAAITGVAVTAEANPNINPAFQRLKVPSQKRMVDVEMNKAILEELVKNLEIAEITLRKETPLVQVIDRPVLPLERKKIGKLKGIVVGAFLGGMLAILVLSLVKYFESVIK